jgi:hypothetical protein
LKERERRSKQQHGHEQRAERGHGRRQRQRQHDAEAADQRGRGSRDTHIPGASIAGHTWQPLDYSEGLVRVGVQSAVSRPETAKLIRKLMKDRGMTVPPENRTVQSICITDICQGVK